MSSSNSFSSRFAFIMASSGAAVGLGNIWMFPFLVGQHGSSAFVLSYALCLVLVGIPALLAETLIGHWTHRAPFEALRQLQDFAKTRLPLSFLAYLGALTLTLIMGFYAVVAGFSLIYLGETFLHGLPKHALEAHATWLHLLQNPLKLLFAHAVVVACTAGVILLGVEKGIEKITTYLMPCLLGMLFLLVAVALIYGDANAAWAYLFAFRPELFDQHALRAAMGQSFFTLATGAGCMLTYGSYLPKGQGLAPNLIVVAFLNLAVSLLAGLAIYPVVFQYGLEPSQGPSLMFESLPLSLSIVPGGRILAMLFFLVLWFAALTSTISLVEPLQKILRSHRPIGRTAGTLLVSALVWGLGIMACLSLSNPESWQVVGLSCSLFDGMTHIVSRALLPLGALGYTLVAGYVLPKEAFEGLGIKPIYALCLRVLMRTLAPLAIIIVILGA